MNLNQCNGNRMLSQGYAPDYEDNDLVECKCCHEIFHEDCTKFISDKNWFVCYDCAYKYAIDED